MNWQTAAILFALVSVAVMPVMIVKEVTTWRKQMWWWILGVVMFCAAWFIWRFVQ